MYDQKKNIKDQKQQLAAERMVPELATIFKKGSGSSFCFPLKILNRSVFFWMITMMIIQ